MGFSRKALVLAHVYFQDQPAKATGVAHTACTSCKKIYERQGLSCIYTCILIILSYHHAFIGFQLGGFDRLRAFK